MMRNCTRCKLHNMRNKIVFGVGKKRAPIMFVGEAPGAQEDEQGMPFVGKAGKRLTKIIEGLGLKRSDVYITNVVKCRPPNNRCPESDEIIACSRILYQEISKIKPRIICALGLTSAQFLIGRKGKIADLRRNFHPYIRDHRIQVKPTYHPSYLFRKPSAEKLFKEDIRAILEKLKGRVAC